MSWDFSILEQELGRYLPRSDVDPEDPRERTRRRILAAATERFAHHGYRKTSVEDIARRAGIAKGTVYLHFKNKADLLIHATAAEKARYVERFRELLDPSRPPRERLRLYLEGVLRWTPEMPLVQRLGRDRDEVRHVLDDIDHETRSRNEKLEEEFVIWLLSPFTEAQGWTPDDLHSRARMLQAFLRSAPVLMDGPDAVGFDRGAYVSLLARTLADGLAGSGRGP